MENEEMWNTVYGSLDNIKESAEGALMNVSMFPHLIDNDELVTITRGTLQSIMRSARRAETALSGEPQEAERPIGIAPEPGSKALGVMIGQVLGLPGFKLEINPEILEEMMKNREIGTEMVATRIAKNQEREKMHTTIKRNKEEDMWTEIRHVVLAKAPFADFETIKNDILEGDMISLQNIAEKWEADTKLSPVELSIYMEVCDYFCKELEEGDVQVQVQVYVLPQDEEHMELLGIAIGKGTAVLWTECHRADPSLLEEYCQIPIHVPSERKR